MSDKNFDPGMKDTCELKEAWADGKKLYYVEDIPGLLEQIASLNKKVEKLESNELYIMSGYGDNWFDGFMAAREEQQSDNSCITDYSHDVIMEMSEVAESEYLKKVTSKDYKALLKSISIKSEFNLISKIIESLFKQRWSGDLADAPVNEMRDQLSKTLRDQTRGYWSGHTAYNLAVDGGFLVEGKKGSRKKLTSLGELFGEQEKLRKEQD